MSAVEQVLRQPTKSSTLLKVPLVTNRIYDLTAQETIYAYEYRARAKRLRKFREQAKVEWILAHLAAEPQIVDFWEAQSRSEIARRSHHQNVTTVLRSCVSTCLRASSRQIAVDIGKWCSSLAISRFRWRISWRTVLTRHTHSVHCQHPVWAGMRVEEDKQSERSSSTHVFMNKVARF